MVSNIKRKKQKSLTVILARVKFLKDIKTWYYQAKPTGIILLQKLVRVLLGNRCTVTTASSGANYH